MKTYEIEQTAKETYGEFITRALNEVKTMDAKIIKADLDTRGKFSKLVIEYKNN